MKNHKRKSFITNCIILNFISLVIVGGLALVINSFVSEKLATSFPILDDLLVYEDRLVKDEYEKIPLKKFNDCAIIIYDTDEKVLYSSNKNISEELDLEDINFINEYHDLEYYIVYNFMKKDEYYIMKVRVDSDTEKEEVVDVAILNTALEIKKGDLFGEEGQISEFQFELMKGNYQDKCIEKYQYKNEFGDDRVLVFISPEFTNENYMRVLEEANKLWLIAIPLIIILIVIEVIFYKRKIKKYIEPLNAIVEAYTNKEEIINDKKTSKEFKPVADKFKLLLEKIDKNEVEKNKLIANISHDLKTPLTAIKGYAQAFKDDIVPEDKKEQYIASIYDKTILATDLINRLFEYTTLEHPEYRLNLEETDINEFSRLYFTHKYSEIEMLGFELEVNIPEQEYKCFIDKGLITRLYDNLISNSLKYNKKGTKILFELIEEKDIVKIIVADNGVGLPQHVRNDLFSPFVTGNTARTSGEGTGLGMAIVKKIVDLHHGKISLNETDYPEYKTVFQTELNIKNKE